MRYLLQIIVMLADLTLIGVSSYTLYETKFDSMIAGMVICAVAIWQEQGGFMAWRPSVVRQFMKNAKKYGL